MPLLFFISYRAAKLSKDMELYYRTLKSCSKSSQSNKTDVRAGDLGDEHLKNCNTKIDSRKTGYGKASARVIEIVSSLRFC